MKVLIRKIRDVEDPVFPHHIDEGYENIIQLDEREFEEPEIGERFNLIGIFRWFSTSPVQKIIDEKTFETLNSVYHWEILKDTNEPEI